ncbi:molybdate ABC transporter substrate-binding protein [Methylomonas sp. MED-D]|uniref:Molybdate ABC transporter substrate-binding protein n=1 Tax=Methylomonas koyamae TaxID=702114 RepID=A0A177NZD5_9GAMM|nr:MULTISPECIES: molybdate ABC transporter substrate-binding protein [Methylomonas]MDT4328794.1 molybdate ABC transporter substrate-binding protein [Methylomonas sp. MV1]NJA06851.1 molybdate ABC transporter substrate-binding protein [Methylococcaceae bacterium WWC4]OAI23271.1 molybdate ABC transporter substrate-binding protein [Methylomonas koyamae]
MIHRLTLRAIVLATSLLPASSAWAATTLVAVAANFTKPMEQIAAEFQKATGHEAKLSFGSSGKFVSQIENGAPFEVFLAADQESAVKLVNAELAVADTRFTYALGKLVLWSATPGLVDEQGEILAKGGFKHLALADPKLAPYGAAAIDVLKKLGLREKLQPLIVQGENISQTHQFVSTGNAELGFVALSQVIDNGKIGSGSGWIVPSDSYNPIRQDAILLNKGDENPAAQALLEFLKGPAASTIILKYGYSLPSQP